MILSNMLKSVETQFPFFKPWFELIQRQNKHAQKAEVEVEAEAEATYNLLLSKKYFL